VLKHRYQTQTVSEVTTKGGITKMLRFTNVEYADMHFVYGSCDGNSLAALWEYQH
jgi:hypothetical protein